MQAHRVAITGAGLISPLATEVAANWAGVKALQTGIRHWPRAGVPAVYAYQGRVEQVPQPEDIPHKLMSQIRFLNPGSRLGLAAAREALASSAGASEHYTPHRRALYIGAGDTTSVGYEFMYPAMKEAVDDQWRHYDQEKLNRAAVDRVNPFFLLESLNNNLFSFLSAYLQFLGPSTSLAAHSPCGSNAVELAYRSIRQGRADLAMAVGCGDWLGVASIYEMEGLGLLSRCRHGSASYRPLARGRDGFIPGAGGAALLLENHEQALARGARVLGTIRGVGNSCESSAETGMGISPAAYRRALDSALEEAGQGAESLGFVIAHGSGTRKGDAAELEALAGLPTAADGAALPVTALKAYTGHMAAASDVAEVVLGIEALRESQVPATLNFDGGDAQFGALNISARQQAAAQPRFVSMSLGIGGQVSALQVEV